MTVVDLVTACITRGLTIATAESLTAGLVAASIADVPGCSAVFRGGVVAYATEVKHNVLGVDDALLDRVGAVDAEVAMQMADGVRETVGADFGVATTGVAGPDGQDGKAPGVVFVAVTTPFGRWHRELLLDGDRDAIRTRSSIAALELLSDVLAALEK